MVRFKEIHAATGEYFVYIYYNDTFCYGGGYTPDKREIAHTNLEKSFDFSW